MFNIGFPEMALIFVVALIVIGPAKLPEIARALGKAYNEFTRSMRDVRQSFDSATSDIEDGIRVIRDPVRAVGKSIEEAILKEPDKPSAPSQGTTPPDPSQKA